MPNDERLNVCKVWLYAAATVTLGAWFSPLLYNAGKALAEVSSSKATNSLLARLAALCRTAEFPWFFKVAMVLAAGVLLLPWLEWLHARSGNGPWRPNPPTAADAMSRGQALRKNPQRLWHAGAGFLLVAGCVLVLGIALSPAGTWTRHHAATGMAVPALQTLAGSLALAITMEVMFRGLMLGIFLRAMRPAPALAMCAVMFALVPAMIPPPGMNVADPEATGTGFEMLRLLAGRCHDWRYVGGTLAPWLGAAGVLAYARWRSASLWLSGGLLTGWLFANSMLDQWTAIHSNLNPHAPMPSNSFLAQGIIPWTTIVLAGVLTHFIAPSHPHAAPAPP